MSLPISTSTRIYINVTHRLLTYAFRAINGGIKPLDAREQTVKVKLAGRGQVYKGCTRFNYIIIRARLFINTLGARHVQMLQVATPYVKVKLYNAALFNNKLF